MANENKYEQAIFKIPKIGTSPEDFIPVRDIKTVDSPSNNPPKYKNTEGKIIPLCPHEHNVSKYVVVKHPDGSFVGSDIGTVVPSKEIVIADRIVLSCSEPGCTWAYDETNRRGVTGLLPIILYLDTLIVEIKNRHNLSDGSISLLYDKGFEQKDFERLLEYLNLPDQTFAERRKSKSEIDEILDAGDSPEITTGRYKKYVNEFKEISSEQALVKGRMKFSVEYVIALADLLSQHTQYNKLVKRAFNDEEKTKLRKIYTDFRTKDYLIVKLLEKKTDHDIVSPNTWISILAQVYGLDEEVTRGITHFARTSDDVNDNICGELYMQAIGKWCSSISKLLSEFEKRAIQYSQLTCVAETHGQKAQLTTMGHIFANLAEQIKRHAESLLNEKKFVLDGKIGGAIGTDVDMKAACPEIDAQPMYKHIVEDLFGLEYIELGNDQASGSPGLAKVLDAMSNVDSIVQKAANDVWHYAARGLLSKNPKKGESGSSAMPQKINPYLAEGCEALMPIVNGEFNTIKTILATYRGQGDLRRSITIREGFHPIMLSIIGIERMISELNRYEASIVGMEEEIYRHGPKIVSSSIQNKLRAEGLSDAYDRIKDIVMKPYVTRDEIESYIMNNVDAGIIEEKVAKKIMGWLYSVMDLGGDMNKLYESSDKEKQLELLKKLEAKNKNEVRKELLGSAILDTYKMVENSGGTRRLLERYLN